MLTQIIDEIKVSWKIILFGICVCAAVMSVVMIFYNLTEYLMPEIYSDYDKKLEEGIEVNIHGMKLSQTDFVNSLGISSFDISVSASKHFYDTQVIGDNGINIYDKEIIWLTEQKYDEYKIPKTISAEEFNNSTGVIVYCNLTEKNTYMTGDKISLLLKNGKSLENYTILEVVADDSIEETKVIFPAKSVIEEMDKAGYSVYYNVSCIYPNVESYINFKNRLKKENINCTSDIDEVVTLYDSLNLLFKIIAVVFTIISVFVIFILSIININIREKFLVLQKVLGAKNSKVTFIFVVIMEIQIFISDIAGSMAGYIYTNYLTKVLEGLYNFKIEVSHVNLGGAILAGIIISNIALIPFAFVIRRVICKKEIVTIINNKD